MFLVGRLTLWMPIRFSNLHRWIAQKYLYKKNAIRYMYRNLWGRRSRTIVADTQQLDSTWHHLKKWRSQSFQQKLNFKSNPMRYKLWICLLLFFLEAQCELLQFQFHFEELKWHPLAPMFFKKRLLQLLKTVHSPNHPDSNDFQDAPWCWNIYQHLN